LCPTCAPQGAALPHPGFQTRAAIRCRIGICRGYELTSFVSNKQQDFVGQNINESVRQAGAALPMRAVRVEVDRSDLEIYADPLFEKVFYNLIDNALKYGGDSMTKIHIFCYENDKGLVLTCEDNGVGIIKKDNQYLFDRGFGKHTGLGLAFSSPSRSFR